MTHGIMYGDEMHQGVRQGAEYAGQALSDGAYHAGQAADHVAYHAGQAADHVAYHAENAWDQGAYHAGQAADHLSYHAGNVLDGAGQAVDHISYHAGNALDHGAYHAGQAFEHGSYHAGRLADGFLSNPYQSIVDGLKYNPHSFLDQYMGSSFQFCLLLAQAIFSVLYFCMVVSNYPYWQGPTPMSCQLQAEPAPCAATSTSPANCCLSYLCPQARAAHTFDKTGVLDYWCGVLAMFFCPFCTLCWANACTDLNPKLGGEPANIIASAVCTWCCSCCVIAQDAESLDAATGMRTEPCGVSGGDYPVPYGGMGPYGGPMGPGMMHGHGMMPGQQMMYPRY
jgi:hypothetical protein